MGNESFNTKSNKAYVLTSDEKKAIQNKAKEIYEKRIALYAADLTESQKEIIINIQKLIFTLDYYSECNQRVDTIILDSFWDKFTKFFRELKMPNDLQQEILQDIKDYASIEASARAGKSLAEYAIDFFYLKKSCDVRMQRSIIRHINQQSQASSRAEIARDVLEEIEDDIDDLEEDESTLFSGNRLMEILNSKDTEKFREYSTFIASFTDAPQDLIQRINMKLSKLDYY